MYKILIFSTSGLKSDGITAWMRQTISAMDQTNLSFETVAWDDADDNVVAGIQNCGITVHFLPNRKKSFTSYCFEFWKLVSRGSYEAIHVCGSSGLMAIEIVLAYVARIPLRICHSHNTTCEHKLADKLTRPWLLGAANCYLACGDDAGHWLFGNHPFTVIHNGKRLHEYAFNPSIRSERRKSLGLGQDDIALGHVGRFNRQKNHAMLLEVFKELRKRSDRFRLILIGDGDLFEATRYRAEEMELGDSVSFLGARRDVPSLLQAMDCMIFPSLYEGLPNVVLEWQLCGLPCVMSSTITDEAVLTGLVAQVELGAGVVPWADKVVQLLGADADRLIESNRACEEAKRRGYDIRDSAAKLRKLYMEKIGATYGG